MPSFLDDFAYAKCQNFDSFYPCFQYSEVLPGSTAAGVQSGSREPAVVAAGICGEASMSTLSLLKNSSASFGSQERRSLASPPLLRLDTVPWSNRCHPSAETALRVVLARVAYPCRWINLRHIFRRSEGRLSTVLNDATTFLELEFREILRWHPQISNYKRLQEFGKAVEEAGGSGKGGFGVL
jgi:hypothetical protein